MKVGGLAGVWMTDQNIAQTFDQESPKGLPNGATTCVRDAGVASSNPVTPTNWNPGNFLSYQGFLIFISRFFPTLALG
jgi:hypothetical protein